MKRKRNYNALPEETQQKLREFVAAGCNITEAARRCNTSWAAANRYAGELVRPKEKIDPVKDAEQRRTSARELAREKAQLHAVAGEKSFRSYLEALLRETTPKIDAPPAYRERKASATATEETLLLLLSDWHAYEIVKPERVMDLNEYNADIMGRRVWRVVDSVRNIASKMRAGNWRFPRLVVACNGDFISGTIHEVEKHSDAPNVIRAVQGCGMVLAQALRDLAGSFDRVDVFGTGGNHGRLPDHKRVSQKDPTRNWDFLIYLMAQAALADVKNISFMLPDSYSCVYDVEGWRFCQNHGHDIKSWQSIPFYGISRTATGLNALRVAAGTPIHYFLYSHFHNPGNICAPGSEYFVNGSLIGGTEFSVNGLGRSDEPSQLLFGVHKEHGVTHRWPLKAARPGPAGSYKVRPWIA